jgi:hypothetical protein
MIENCGVTPACRKLTLFECRRARVRFQRLPQRSFVNPLRFKQAIDRSASLFSKGAGNSFEKCVADRLTSFFRFLPQNWKRRQLITTGRHLFNHDIESVRLEKRRIWTRIVAMSLHAPMLPLPHTIPQHQSGLIRDHESGYSQLSARPLRSLPQFNCKAPNLIF